VKCIVWTDPAKSPGVRLRSLGELLPCPFRKDFLQALAIEGKLGACVFCHLLCDFEPVYGHETRILSRHPFAKTAKEERRPNGSLTGAACEHRAGGE
jgi:hypothetical protein